MYKANFKLEVITPLMMSNGEVTLQSGYQKTINNKNGKKTFVQMQKELKTVELRAASIKGVMRWWYRAMLGLDDVEQLKKSEDKIFGSTDCSSKIRLKIEKENLLLDEWSNEFWDDYNCSNIEGKKYINGYRYLSYTSFVESPKDGKTAVRKFIKEDSTFNLIIISMDKEAFESAMISFWFALHFGGFGNRARRGFGKLQAVSADISPIPVEGDVLSRFNFCYGKDLNEQKKTIENGISGWKEYRKKVSDKSAPTTKYTNIVNAKLFFIEDKADFHCKDNLDNVPFTKWQLALNDAGKRLQYFRQSYPDDKTEIVKGYNGKDVQKIDIDKLKKPVMGLPIVFKKYDIAVKHQEDKNKGIGDRFASPLWISIHKIGKNYYPAFLFMFSNPAQGMDIIVNKRNGNKNGIFKQNNNILNEFINSQLKTITPIEFTL
jgi:CRISPR-associated protein Cmr1